MKAKGSSAVNQVENGDTNNKATTGISSRPHAKVKLKASTSNPLWLLILQHQKKLIISLEKLALHPPQKEGLANSTRQALYPFECRQAKLTYSGRFSANVCLQYEGDAAIVQDSFSFGQFPIMLKFKRCNLRGASPRKLVSLKGKASEMGGYFIVNGLERYIRPIIMPKRNYPMSTVRSSFSEKREGYADKAVVIRCVRADQTSLTVKLYYLRNGSARLGFWIQGREYMLPVGIFFEGPLSDVYELCKTVFASHSSWN
ncbi:hypothetical protein KIW84_022536 [Lathyrus oleraceus]|uniref:DNA-directed RNA polymerase n=1 Tax=Pisum sativum TaxID=3888 RepID=A0A9D4YBX4_PEA|nr:hypothetical protein KIW84_022536 [Pisum sativum]